MLQTFTKIIIFKVPSSSSVSLSFSQFSREIFTNYLHLMINSYKTRNNSSSADNKSPVSQNPQHFPEVPAHCSSLPGARPSEARSPVRGRMYRAPEKYTSTATRGRVTRPRLPVSRGLLYTSDSRLRGLHWSAEAAV